jgi:hypothetical protein
MRNPNKTTGLNFCRKLSHGLDGGRSHHFRKLIIAAGEGSALVVFRAHS